MESETTKLTIRLPSRDGEFAKEYARAHGMTVTEFIDRYLRRMRALEQQEPAPEVEAMTGLVPADVENGPVGRASLCPFLSWLPD